LPLSQYALAWVMRQAGVTAPIIGPRTMEQLDDNIEAAKAEFSKEELEAIDKLIPRGRMASPYYEADFGPHAHRL